MSRQTNGGAIVLITVMIMGSACGSDGGSPSGDDTASLSGTAGDATPLENSPGVTPYPDEVTSVTYGEGAGYGQELMPDLLFDQPLGTGGGQGIMDAISLGNGGQIVLGFTDAVIIDGPGDDFVVYENPFFLGTDDTYAEVGVVGVSQDGVNFVDFPFDYVAGKSTSLETFIGFAGVMPGGDRFDLAQVGLGWAAYVRIRDAGKAGETDSRILDAQGEFVDDDGNICCGGDKEGFDLEGVLALHQGDVP